MTTFNETGPQRRGGGARVRALHLPCEHANGVEERGHEERDL